MIGIIMKSKNFGVSLRYHWHKMEQGQARVLASTFAYAHQKLIQKELKFVRLLRPNRHKFLFNASISFPKNEKLQDDQMAMIAKEYLSRMGFTHHQYIVFRHFDTEHPHLHIMANIVGYDGSAVSHENDYQRSEKILRDLEKQHGLSPVIDSRLAQERAMTKSEFELMNRTGQPSVKMCLQVSIKAALEREPSTAHFISFLADQGVDVLFHQTEDGSISGISYSYEGRPFAGARLGSIYKWPSIKKNIGYEQERDRTAIHEANLRTRAGQASRAARSESSGNQGIGTNQKIAAGHPAIVHQVTGELPDEVGKAGRYTVTKSGSAGNEGGEYLSTVANDRQRRGASVENQRQSGQPVGDQALPDRGVNRDLRGADHSAARMDKKALKDHAPRKRRKGLSM